MQFSEADGLWQNIPEWAKFLVIFGFRWHKIKSIDRKIALISMPCDSSAAGLVALGVIRRFLADPDANDIGLHLQRIRTEKNKILLHRTYPRCKFRYSGTIKYNDCDIDMIVQIKNIRSYTSPGPQRINFNPRDVCFQGEPFLEVTDGNELPNSSIYRELVSEGGDILETNLRKTHSGVCLAGRNLGEKATCDIMSNIQFRFGDTSAGLDQLLSVHKWISGEKISRLSFFNSRTRNIDRKVVPSSLVIADGDGAFFTVLGDDLFKQSDIIAIIDRTLERDRLERISDKMASQSQWYVRVETIPEDFPLIPAGISIAIWSRR
jgi:hypothetical protein